MASSPLELELVTEHGTPHGKVGNYTSWDAFQILKAYLEGAEDGKPARIEAFEKLYAMMPKEAPKKTSFEEYDVSYQIVQLGRQIPYWHPWQMKLVRLVRELGTSEQFSIRQQGSILVTYRRLAALDRQIHERHWHFPNPETDPAQLLNLSAFAARLSSAGVLNSDAHFFWALRDLELETKVISNPIYKLAAVWALGAGPVFFNQYFLYPDPPTANDKQWFQCETLYNGPIFARGRWDFGSAGWRSFLKARRWTLTTRRGLWVGRQRITWLPLRAIWSGSWSGTRAGWPRRVRVVLGGSVLYRDHHSFYLVFTNRMSIHINGTSFALNGRNVSYRFHVDERTGDLRSDHFGGLIAGPIPEDPEPIVDGWTGMPDRVRREFPDHGRGDFRVPAFQIRQGTGHTVSLFQYRGHEVVDGKPGLAGLPAIFADQAKTLIVRLYDKFSDVEAALSYSVFPEADAIVRSVSITNRGANEITVESLASLSVDFPFEELEMVSLCGDWAREAHRQRQKVNYGVQSIGSTTGFSSHLHNPFVFLVHPSTTESQGDAWGFSLVYSGSFTISVEKGSQGLTRVSAGPNQLSWKLGPGETLTSPECVAVYSATGIGGMSRSLHRLYRNHLIKSRFATEDRPVLLNSWEGLYFDIDQDRMYQLAENAADLGIKLLVMDDGWFGDEHPRTSDTAGLGDWIPNPMRFPDGLESLVDRVTALEVANSSQKLRFGIWVEPEMVNPKSNLYQQHPDWVLHAANYPRTEQRSQLVLNLGLPEVQQYIITAISDLLNSADITYVKWDHNRGLAETPSPSANYAYILGMYRVFDVLTTRFPNILWEGCASGGGRYDPGILQYFPQVWASDDSDAVERIFIQFGTSLAYPPSSMGGHVSSVPNHQTGRTTPLLFRAHVAMMCGSFGFELDPAHMTEEEQKAVPELISMAEKVSPIVLKGDMWRLRLPEDSNWPAALFISGDGSKAVLFFFQIKPLVNHTMPRVRLQGLDGQAMYLVDGDGPFSGSMLMNLGLQYSFRGDYGSILAYIERQ